ncbi:MAG: fibronectin type III domain-containing protein [Pseudomonadota bacterium]
MSTVPDVIAEPDAIAEPEVIQQKVDLSWSPPATRTDGSVLILSDLEGYRIYSGSSPDQLILLVDLIEGATDYSISNLSPGIHYFAVTAYDLDGLESGFSEIVAKEII